MKKILSGIMAAALVASLSVTAFAATVSPAVLYDGDGVASKDGSNLSASLPSGTAVGTIKADPVLPNTTFYVPLGATQTGAAGISLSGDTNKVTTVTVDELTNSKYFSFKVDKDEGSKLIKKISVVTEKALGSLDRTSYLKVELNDTTTTSELKTTGTITFKAKAAKITGQKPGSTETSTSTSVWDQNAVVSYDYDLWVNNTKVGNDDNPGTGDRVVYNPTNNETNSLVWGDDRAALKFDANDDASKFYARLSTKSNFEVYATYGDPVNADLWFYDFVGNPTIPSTSRATLTLGLGWDSDDDYAPNPADVFIYEIDADGVLTDVTDKFTYSEDDTDIEGWSIKTRTLGSYVISDTELDLDVAEVEDDETSSAPTTDGGKEIPNTASSDMVNVAVVAAVVSLAAAGAVAFRKVK